MAKGHTSASRSSKQPKNLSSTLRYEALEQRQVLSGNPVVSLTASPTSIDEGDNAAFEFSLADMATGGGGSIGLDPAAFTSLGNFTATSDLVINTSDSAITFSLVEGILNPPKVTVPALSLWDGTSVITAAQVIDPDGAGPAVETAVFAFDNFTLPSGFELTAIGSRPVALLANGDMAIGGVIDVSPQSTGDNRDGTTTSNDDLFIPGAGGGAGGSLNTSVNGSPALGASFSGAGRRAIGSNDGGGGAFGGDGSKGFGSSANNGIAYGDLLLNGIQGGSGGGIGGGGFGGRIRQGGDGGGGVELGATGSIDITGQVLANGGDTVNFAGTALAAGGGAGGGIFVHGGDVTLGAASVLEAEGSHNGLPPLDGNGFPQTAGIGGGGGGGRVLIAHAGAYTNLGVDNVSVAGGLGHNAGQDGVFTVVQDTSNPVLDAYDFVISWGDGSPDTIGVITNAAIGAGNAVTGSFVANHTYADDGNYNITVTVTATAADTSTRTGNLSELKPVANVAPTLTIAGDSTSTEGASYTLNLSSFDPGDDTITGWNIAWGDGSTSTIVGNPSSVSHTFLDDGLFTITATATDEDGTFSANSLAVDVANVAPTLTIAGDSTSSEGASYTLNLSSFDPGDDTITGWNIAWGDGSTSTIVGNPASVNHTYADDGLFTITATATDEDGTFSANSLAVDVANVAPTLTIAGDSTGWEGTAYTLSLSSFDPGDDTISGWNIAWGDGSVSTIAGNPTSVSHTYLDDGLFTITATATDEDGTFSANSLAVDVANVAPTIDSLTTDSPAIGGAEQGEVVNLTASFSDDGVLDTHTALIEWGDGVTSVGSIVGGVITADHTYAEGGIYDVIVTLTDDDGGVAVELTGTIIAGVGVHDGELQLIGTNGHDKFKVFKWFGGNLKVLYRLDSGAYQWDTINEPVDEITMLLGDGDDLGFVSSWVGVDATIDGGAGDDFLIGGGGDDTIIGGAGYDLMLGRSGRNLMIGGLGGDMIIGGGGSDILIAGPTAFDANADALDAIMAEWKSNRSYAERVDNIRGDLDNSQDGLNGDYFLIASGEDQTVFDDEATDWLIGGSGLDLYFEDMGDFSTASVFEVVDEIEAEAPTA